MHKIKIGVLGNIPPVWVASEEILEFLKSAQVLGILNIWQILLQNLKNLI